MSHSSTFVVHLRRRALMVVLVLALVVALLPTAAFAAADSSQASPVYATGRYQPQPSGHGDRYDRRDKRPDKDMKHMRCDTTYRVRKGDNLTKIARHFHTSVQALVRANNLRNPNRIIAGQVLCIP